MIGPLNGVSCIASTSSIPSRNRPSLSSSLLQPLRTTILFLTLLTLVSQARAAALHEPAGNQVLLGAWVDTAAGYADTPAAFNKRTRLNFPVFQIAQLTPLPPYNYVTGAGGAAPESLIELSETDAAVFLTVYPQQGFAAVGVPELTVIGNQILNYQTKLNRTVFLRYAPEFQGLWNVYGFQPVEFVASWILMHNTIKAIAPDTVLVWAPNAPAGYPYGQTFFSTSPGTSAANVKALDTNGDGAITNADDALSPWWPGPQYVDWVGISLYYKGPGGTAVNTPQINGFCAGQINGTDPYNPGNPITNWYTTYCEQMPGVACMFAESGAAYRPLIANGATALQIHQAWLNDCYSTAFLDQFPRIKLIMQFEYKKNETDVLSQPVLNDYRLTNDSADLAAFVSQLGAESTRFSFANYRAKPTFISTPGAGPPHVTVTVTNPAYSVPGSNPSGTTVSAIVSTTRARSTSFPQLFGTTSSTTRTALVELAVIVAAGIAGVGLAMKWL